MGEHERHWLSTLLERCFDPDNIEVEKAICAYLNSSLGWTALIGVASPRTLSRPDLSLDAFCRIPVPVLQPAARKRLAAVFDSLADSLFGLLHTANTDPTRAAAGRGFSGRSWHQPRDDHNGTTGAGTRTVGLDLKDGTYLYGPLFAFSTDLDENDHADEPQRCRLWDFEVDSLGSSNPSKPRRMRTADGGRMSGAAVSDNRHYGNPAPSECFPRGSRFHPSAVAGAQNRASHVRVCRLGGRTGREVDGDRQQGRAGTIPPR